MTGLTTRRLILRPLAVDDAVPLHAAFGDPLAMAYWDAPPHRDPAATAAMIARHVAEMAAATHAYWTVVAGTSVAGVVDLSDIDRSAGSAEIGYILAPAWWRRGLASEAVAAIIDHAGATGLHRLTARSQVGNAASLALLARLGFVATGTSTVARAGEIRDCILHERREARHAASDRRR